MTVYFGGIFLWRVRRIPAGSMPLHPAWIFFTKREKKSPAIAGVFVTTI